MFELELNQGINILVGNNESGKSTILEAIHLALTGIYNGHGIHNELSSYLLLLDRIGAIFINYGFSVLGI